jgi:hypothetical protein
MGTRVDPLTFQRRTEATFPDRIGRLVKLQEQIELLREQIVIVPRVQAKQRIGLAERASADDDLGSALAIRSRVATP